MQIQLQFIDRANASHWSISRVGFNQYLLPMTLHKRIHFYPLLYSTFQRRKFNASTCI